METLFNEKIEVSDPTVDGNYFLASRTSGTVIMISAYDLLIVRRISQMIEGRHEEEE